MNEASKAEVLDNVKGGHSEPTLSELLKAHLPKVPDIKFHYYEKLPIELQFKILEDSLVDEEPIEVCNYVAQNEFFIAHAHYWKTWEQFINFSELANTLPHPASREFGHTTSANQGILMSLIQNFFSRAGVDIWSLMTENQRKTLTDYMWNIVAQLRWNPKLKKSGPRITTDILRKEYLCTPLGFPLAHTWLMSIGNNKRYIREMQVQLPNIPSSAWINEDKIRSDLIGRFIDQDSQVLGLQQFPHLKTDRLLQSIAFFKRFYTECPNSLKVLTLHIGIEEVHRWMARKDEITGPAVENPKAHHPLDELLCSKNGEGDSGKPFSFVINLVIQSCGPRITDQLVEDIETNDFFASMAVRLQWGEVTIMEKR